MRIMILSAALTAGFALSGCTGTSPDGTPLPLTDKQASLLDKQLSGKVAGEVTSCISHSPQANIIRVSDDLLLYRVSGRLVYQNRLRSPCPGLARDDDIMVSRQFGSQQCRGDHFQLVDRVGGIAGPTCVLGDFIPYRKSKG